MGLTRVGAFFGGHDDARARHVEHLQASSKPSDGDGDDVEVLRRRAEACDEQAKASTAERDTHAAEKRAANARARRIAGEIAGLEEKLALAEEGLKDCGATVAELDAVDAALEKVKHIQKKQFDEMKGMVNPSPSIRAVLTAVHLILTAERYPTRRAAGKARDDWEAIRTTLVSHDFVQRMSTFDTEKEFSTGCEHVASLIVEELIEPDDDGKGEGKSRGSGERKPTSSIPKTNTKTPKIHPKILAKSPLGGSASPARQPKGKVVVAAEDASRASSEGSTPVDSPLHPASSTAASAQPQPRTAGNPPDAPDAGATAESSKGLSSKWIAAIAAALPSHVRRYTFSEVAYANKTAAALFEWVVAQLQKHRFSVMNESIRDLPKLRQAHEAAQLARAEAKATLASAEAAEKEAGALAVAKANEATELRAEMNKLETERLAAEAKRRIDERCAAAKAQEKRAKEDEQINRVKRRLVLHPSFRNDTLRRARVRFEKDVVNINIEDADNMATLAAVTQVMLAFPTMMFNVTGTPGVGEPTDFSRKLPLARAEACVAWLVDDGGVPAARLRVTTAELGHRDDELDDNADTRALVCFNAIRELTSVSHTDHVTFDGGSANISPPCLPAIKGVARFLVDNGFGSGGVSGDNPVITVEGHTCSDGGRTYNEALSQERAEAVVGVLEGEGVDPRWLRAVGRGGTKPREDNATEGGRFGNRRVEFLVVEG